MDASLVGQIYEIFF